MATIQTDDERLTVRFTRWEKVTGVLRDVEVPWTAVSEVRAEPDGFAAVRGFRAPGLALPRRTKIGTWRQRGRRTAVCVAAGQPAVRIALTGGGYDELLIGDPDAARTVAAVQAGATGPGVTSG